MDRKLNGEGSSDGQNYQQYMSDSPWGWNPVFEKVQSDLCGMEAMGEGTLNFDETGDKCSGMHKAGAARQYLGREGKTDMGQVTVLASYSKDGVWTLVDAELFLPRIWFEAAYGKKWKTLRIPSDRVFHSKVSLAKEQFGRALANGLPFRTVGMDSLYGSDVAFRMEIGRALKFYMASVKKDTQVWLSDPSQDSDAKWSKVEKLALDSDFSLHVSRQSERGPLAHEHAFRTVWTKENVAKDAENPLGYRFNQETLVIRKELDGKTTYALSNIPQDNKQELVQARAERYFVERTIQDAKSELGLDEVEARKYPAIMHTLALCAVALLYMATLKLEWRKDYAPTDQVNDEFPDVKRLPDISLANVKELFRAAFPLPPISKQQAVNLVTQKLFNRTKATQSRAKKKNHMQKKLT